MDSAQLGKPACNENLDTDDESRARHMPRLVTTRTPDECTRSRRTRESAPASASDFVETLRSMVRDIVREELVRSAPATTPDPRTHLSTRAAAQHAGVALGTIRRWIHDGKLRELRAGRHLRVRRTDLDALLCGDRTGPDPSPEELAREAFGG